MYDEHIALLGSTRIYAKYSFSSILVTVILGTLCVVYLAIYALSHNPRSPYVAELEYMTIGNDGKRIKCRFDKDAYPDHNIKLSIVVPSYNETARIRSMLSEAVQHLQNNYPNQWEIIVVDDGSSDGTSDYCLKLSHEVFKLKPHCLKVLKLLKNRGKGGAVKQGMLHSMGRYVLFADADGASEFADIERLLKSVQRSEQGAKPAIALGSRAHMVNTEAVIKRSLLRNCLMYGFHTLVFMFGIRSVKDTQCGFKLFNRKAVDLIFPFLHTEGWIFDVEVLILAFNKSIVVEEIQISWHEVDGSKMALAIDSLKMAKDLIIIRMAYVLGIYSPDRIC